MATTKKSTPAKKPAKASAKKAAPAKKPAPAAKKPVTKKPAPAKKPVAKKAAKAAPAAKKPAKAPAKKAAAKKAAPVAKKAVAKKPAPAKKPVAKKAAPVAKKAPPAKKPVSPKAPAPAPAAKKPAKKRPSRSVKAGWPPILGVKNNPLDVGADRKATLPARQSELSAEQLAEFTEALLRELELQNKNCAALLRDNLKREETENLYATHQADIGSETFDQAINLLLAGGRQQNIRAIADALRRIKAGTFGQCVACGKAINIERLKAHPQAHLCIECQSAAEKGKLIYAQVGQSIAEEGGPGGDGE